MKEIIEQCYEHLAETAGRLYVNTEKDKDTAHKTHPWMDHVIWEAFSEGRFYDFIDDKLITGELMIEIIQYCSDYHKQREKDNGSLTNKVIPNWVEHYLERQVVIQQGHTLYSILDLFGEAVCYMNREEAYTQILFVINTHLDLKTFREKAESDMAADPMFREWVSNHIYHCKVTSFDIEPPKKIQRQVCTMPPYSMFEKLVEEGVTYEEFRSRYDSFLETRDVNLEEVNAVLKKSGVPGSWMDPIEAVDVFGWVKEDAIMFVKNYKKIISPIEQPVPRRSSRLKRKRSE